MVVKSNGFGLFGLVLVCSALGIVFYQGERAIHGQGRQIILSYCLHCNSSQSTEQCFIVRRQCNINHSSCNSKFLLFLSFMHSAICENLANCSWCKALLFFFFTRQFLVILKPLVHSPLQLILFHLSVVSEAYHGWYVKTFSHPLQEISVGKSFLLNLFISVMEHMFHFFFSLFFCLLYNSLFSNKSIIAQISSVVFSFTCPLFTMLSMLDTTLI